MELFNKIFWFYFILFSEWFFFFKQIQWYNTIILINNETKEQQIDNEDDYIIPLHLFEVEKLFILLKLPFWEQNEVKSIDFIKKFHKFTNNNFRLAISWKTRKMKTLFKIKDKNLYQACRIYYGECEHYRYNYIGETVKNTVTRWSEHNNPDHKSDPTEHIKKIWRFYAQFLQRNISGRT